MEALKHLQARAARRVLLTYYYILLPVLTKTSYGTVRELICVWVSSLHFTFEDNSISSFVYLFFQIKHEAKSQLEML